MADDDSKKQFAADILEAVKRGALPPEEMHRAVVVLAQMVIALAESNKAQREQVETFRGCAESLAWILNPPRTGGVM